MPTGVCVWEFKKVMTHIDSAQIQHYVNAYLIPWGVRLVIAALIFAVGRWLAKLIVKLMQRVMERAKIDPTLNKFLGSIVYALLLVAIVIAALDQIGVNTTSLLALLGAAGLAVGLAVKDSLSNFSAGVMLIIFRPFKIGDYIEAGGTAGTVENIQVFSTILLTPDNREITVPNGAIFGGKIVNVSARSTRRIDLVFGISYTDDIAKARTLMMKVMSEDERVLKDPEPAVSLAELADSSVNLNVRPWVKSSDYWAVRSDLLERIKAVFDRNGISIPFPQRDVHLYPKSEEVA